MQFSTARRIQNSRIQNSKLRQSKRSVDFEWSVYLRRAVLVVLSDRYFLINQGAIVKRFRKDLDKMEK
ncbi:hypothetical protein LC613_15590 [Nostoc sphaeroides CHAB 2801]|uniref:hypothetical protein n=1 Tax=Nostoc sphaeroides TaxID=446679 RepID=UPI000E4CFB24|nr:hypothetical protein [Nostoc sphaeroides]MCC5629411.1 hypothetical protein [Nostoc sphaeroides CHAB 2801]